MITTKIHSIVTNENVSNQTTAPTNGVGEIRPLADAQQLIFNNTVSHSTILRMAKRKEFPAFKLLGGKWYFVLEVAQEWLIEKHRQCGWEISNSSIQYKKGA